MKRTLLRELGIKRIEPLAFEINRVRQYQIRVSGINHAVRDAGDAAVRLVARPLIDFRSAAGTLAKSSALMVTKILSDSLRGSPA